MSASYHHGAFALADMVGEVIGGRTVLGYARNSSGSVVVRCQCECGRVSRVRLSILRKGERRWCHPCSQLRIRTRKRPASRDAVMRTVAEAIERCPEVWLGESQASLDAVGELAASLSGMTHAEIAPLVRRTRQCVQQIETRALKKARLRMGAAGREYIEHLNERQET